MKELLLGIDIGTSACKVGLFTAHGELLGAADSPYSVRYPHAGWAEQDPDEWWRASVRAIRDVMAQTGAAPGDIAGIGVDGQSWSMIPVDAQGNVLHPTPIWTDTRSREECEEMKRAVGEERLFACSGNPVNPSYTLPKVFWLQKHCPEAFARTEKVLQSNSFIVYRLTGALTQDPSQGYGWNCFNVEKGAWDEEVVRGLNLPARLLPEVRACSEVVGQVSAAAAALTGLAQGTPVVAGGLDAACATLGVGVLDAGETQEQGGQAGGMSLCMERCAAHPALILSSHVLPGRWLLQGGTTGGGGALKWFREQFCPQMSFEQMSREAAKAPDGSGGVMFLPFMAGERSPLWNPDAKGVFYGLSFSATRAEMIRAVMEGVAFSLRHNLDTAAEAGASATLMRSTGGSGKSPVWMQIKADVTGRQMEALQTDTAAARGAAMLAGLGTGVWKTACEAAQGIRVTARYTPDEARSQRYQRRYEAYRELVAAMEPLYNK